jgi:hypothetical protein
MCVNVAVFYISCYIGSERLPSVPLQTLYWYVPIIAMATTAYQLVPWFNALPTEVAFIAQLMYDW